MSLPSESPRTRVDTLPRDPHRRYNALTGDWVLVSAGRTNRPWQGSTEGPAVERRPTYDPDCYLCPGNERANGARNPDYDETLVFTNDFAALRPDVPTVEYSDGILRAETEPGTCRVICYSPRHDVDLAGLSPGEIRRVVDLWAEQVEELSEHHRWVQIFENRGKAMGASNPHPHGQLWAGDALPVEPAKEDARQREHHATTGRPLLLDYMDQERSGDRLVVDGDHWVVVVPFWAVWPFETLVLPTRHVGRLPDLTDEERDGLASTLHTLLGAYDRVFDHPFPYSMGFHGAPSGGADHWQLHAHAYPPLLRSATVRKFMVGYELLAEAQRDITAEEAATRLRELVG